ncbi:superoxide dismutase [Dipodascopsis tothii]|uniref:superoxide dismutase n=1 Tax=Dipodascopsis tothii TaxID=44089 RepID=UPI0034CD6859
MTLSIKSVFAVPLECEACVADVSKALQTVPGIERYDVNLADQLVSVEGEVAPSSVVSSIRSTGRDAIVRGSGEPNSAAVCILETHDPKFRASPIRGLARMVKASASTTLLDLTLDGMPPNSKFYASIRTSGNISNGALSAGEKFMGLGTIDSDDQGVGQSFLLKEGLSITDIIGRSVVVGSDLEGKALHSEDVVGVIARSAGAWQNDKTVCSCSGKTVWQERKDAIQKGLRT